jgi:hypothetical protein
VGNGQPYKHDWLLKTWGLSYEDTVVNFLTLICKLDHLIVKEKSLTTGKWSSLQTQMINLRSMANSVKKLDHLIATEKKSNNGEMV